MRRTLLRLNKVVRLSAQRFRLAVLRLRLGRDVAPKRVAVGAGVRISATDGASLRIGDRTSIDTGATIQVKFGRLEIGSGSFVGRGSVIVARESIVIGNDALIAEYVTIRDQDHGFIQSLPRAKCGYLTSAIRIGNNVWLGAKVTVLKGVSIGDNVVVGANSVVTRDLPPNVVAAGVPARVIREVDESELIRNVEGSPSA